MSGLAGATPGYNGKRAAATSAQEATGKYCPTFFLGEQSQDSHAGINYLYELSIYAYKNIAHRH